MQHIDEILFQEGIELPLLAPCDHYAGREDFIRKAFALQRELGPCFDITCDLEDGSAKGHPIEHARALTALISSDLNAWNAAGLRIHPPANDLWREELAIAIEGAGRVLSHITIPKAKSADEVFMVYAELQELRTRHGIEREIPLHVLIETQEALRSVFEIAAVPGLRCLDFGIMDFISGHDTAIPLDCTKSPGQFEHALLRRAKTLIVAAACAHGLAASHNVTVGFRDTEQTRADALRAHREFGFTRMWSIHPSQIRPIVEAMSPSFAELEKAVALLAKAQAASWGPLSYDEELHDRASYRYYWQLIKRARRCGRALPEGAEAFL